VIRSRLACSTKKGASALKNERTGSTSSAQLASTSGHRSCLSGLVSSILCPNPPPISTVSTRMLIFVAARHGFSTHPSFPRQFLQAIHTCFACLCPGQIRRASSSTSALFSVKCLRKVPDQLSTDLNTPSRCADLTVSHVQPLPY
jgi:hypothetical protein